MTFLEILPKFLEGKKVKRKNWKSSSYLQIKNGKPVILTNQINPEYTSDGEDFMGKDWYLVED